MRRQRRKGFAYIVTVSYSQPSELKQKNLPLTPLSKNDLDSVDILQLVLTQNMCVSSAPETHAYRPHSMSRVRGQQVGMQHHGSEHNEVITLSGCKIMGSSLQSSCLFGWHSLSGSIISCWVFFTICYVSVSGLLLFHNNLIKRDKIIFLPISAGLISGLVTPALEQPHFASM